MADIGRSTGLKLKKTEIAHAWCPSKVHLQSHEERMQTDRVPGYCIHFPSAHSSAYESKSLAAIISCTWSYEDFCFLYSAEALALDTLEQSIAALIDGLLALQLRDRDRAAHYLFKLDFNQVNNTALFRNKGWTCNFLFMSGKFFGFEGGGDGRIPKGDW